MRNLTRYELFLKATDLIYKALPGKAVLMREIHGRQAPYDILWNKHKLCVRVARPSAKTDKLKWYFAVESKEKERIDFFIMMTLLDNEVYKVFVLPPQITPDNMIAITEREGSNIRYESFSTSLNKLADKILGVEDRLPELLMAKQE